MSDFRSYLGSVAPIYLNKAIWLQRDTRGEVVADFLKGEIPSKHWFRRSQLQMLIQSLIFAIVWFFLVYGAFSVARLLIGGILDSKYLSELSQFDFSWSGGFLLAATANYWNFSKRYGEQWTYCAGVFNKIFYDKFPTPDPIEHLFRKATFAIDLLDCNLWHHKSFCTDFNYILECAVYDELGSNDDAYINKIQEFKNGTKRHLDARDTIATFQNKLELHLQTRAPVVLALIPPQSRGDDSLENVGG